MGWSNDIPNPFTVGGGGVSGRIEVYRANDTLLATIDENGIFFYDEQGAATAAISDEGNGTFQDLNVIESPSFGGRDFETEWMKGMALGIQSYGVWSSNVTTGGVNVEKGIMELSFVADATRMYRVMCQGQLLSTVASENYTFFIRDGGTSSPTTSSTLIGFAEFTSQAANVYWRNGLAVYVGGFTAGQHRLLMSFRGALGGASLQTGNVPAKLWVEDIGPLVSNTAVVNTGSGGGSAPQMYQTTYNATWSGSYNGSGVKSTFGGSDRAYQGNIGDGNGNRTSLIGFDYAQIVSDLAGATINNSWCVLYAQHWYYNAGGTAVIGTHNQAVSSAPASFGSNSTNLVTSSGWPKPGQRTVGLGTTIGNAFKNGTAKGLALGPGQGGDPLTYYGYFSGFGAVNPPQLIINYTK